MARKLLGSSLLLAAAALAAPLALPASAALARPEATAQPTALARPGVAPQTTVSPGVVRSGAWSRVTNTATNADVGLARGKDGVLHVLWITGNAPKIRIMDTLIGQLGVVRSAVTVVSGWSMADFPGAAAASSGLDAFWVGTKPGDPSANGLFEATRPLSGGKWSAPKVAVSGADFGVRDYSETASGTQTWAAFDLSKVLAVSAAGQKFVHIAPTACCVYRATLAANGSTGAVSVGYSSLVAGHEGIFVQKLTAAGTASGAAVRLPGSVTSGKTLVPQQHIGLTGRGTGHGGLYTAYATGYPTRHKAELFRIGAAKARVLASTSGSTKVGAVTLAADPQGRLWAAWVIIRSGTPHLYVSRSNTAATSFGKVQSVALPAHTGQVQKLYLSPESARLDVLALTSQTKTSPAAYWSRMVTPPK
jgi:hypothetical protein